MLSGCFDYFSFFFFNAMLSQITEVNLGSTLFSSVMWGVGKGKGERSTASQATGITSNTTQITLNVETKLHCAELCNRCETCCTAGQTHKCFSVIFFSVLLLFCVMYREINQLIISL